jgi:hypothetical protein
VRTVVFGVSCQCSVLKSVRARSRNTRFPVDHQIRDRRTERPTAGYPISRRRLDTTAGSSSSRRFARERVSAISLVDHGRSSDNQDIRSGCVGCASRLAPSGGQLHCNSRGAAPPVVSVARSAAGRCMVKEKECILSAARITLDDLLEIYSGHGAHHAGQITDLRARKGW